MPKARSHGGQSRSRIGGGADGPGPRRGAGAVEVESHLIAHDLGLFADFLRKGRGVAVRLVHDDAERRFERMGEIADLGARTLHDFAIGADQQIEFAASGAISSGNSPAMFSDWPRRTAITSRRNCRKGRRP